MASNVRFIRVHGHVVPVKPGSAQAKGKKMSKPGSRPASSSYYQHEATKSMVKAGNSTLALAPAIALVGLTRGKGVFGKLGLGLTAANAISASANYAKANAQKKAASGIRKLEKRGKR